MRVNALYVNGGRTYRFPGVRVGQPAVPSEGGRPPLEPVDLSHYMLPDMWTT